MMLSNRRLLAVIFNDPKTNIIILLYTHRCFANRPQGSTESLLIKGILSITSFDVSDYINSIARGYFFSFNNLELSPIFASPSKPKDPQRTLKSLSH